MLTALAIDPGPTRSGVAAVSFDGRRFQLRYGKHLRFGGGVHIAGAYDPLVGADELDFLLDDVAASGAILLIEKLIGYAYEANRVQALCETCGVEWRIAERAIARGLVPSMVPAPEWMGELCRSATASREQIDLMVEALVDGAATCDTAKDRRQHINDAAGLAVVELCRAARVPIPRTPALERALLEQQAADKRARAAKRAAAQAGDLAPEKRGMTRAQRARRSGGAKKGWQTRRGV